MGLVSVPEAAQRLGVTRARVHQRIASGSLPAQQVGRQWIIDEWDLRRIAHHGVPGRPFSATSAWALIAVSAGDAGQFSPSVRSRARTRHAQLLRAVTVEPDLEVVASLLGRALGGRARRIVYRASVLDLPAVRTDPRLHLSGVSASASQISAGEVVEGYLKADDLDDLVDAHLLAPVGEDRASVIIHVVNGDWEIHDWVTSDLVIAADLAEHGGPRERARAQKLVADLAAGQ